MLATLREPGSRRLLINFAAFELGWLACVLGGSVIGALAAALIALHLARQARPGEWRWLAVVGGALSGPLSYYAGARLAGVELAPWLLPAQALVWGLLCLWLSRRLGSTSPDSLP